MILSPEWQNRIHSLLSSSSSKCLACGKSGRASALYPSLCINCAARIPWIRVPRCRKCGRSIGCPDCTRGGDSSPIVCNRSAVAYNSEMRAWLGQYKYRGNESYAPLFGIMLDQAYQLLQAEQEWEIAQLSEVNTKRQLHPVFNTFQRYWSALLHRRHSATAVHWQADLLIPVPVSESRLMERGFNQAERLADELSRRQRIPVISLLVRTHHTAKQSFKSRAERLADMKHAFAPDKSLEGAYSEWLRLQKTLFEPASSLASGERGAAVPLSVLSFGDLSIASAAPVKAPKQIRPVRIIIVDDIYTTGSTIRACAESIRQITDACGLHSQIFSLTWARS